MNTNNYDEEMRLWGFTSRQEHAAFRLLIKAKLREHNIEYTVDDTLTLMVRALFTEVVK